MISFGFFFAVIFLVFTFLVKGLKLKTLYFILLLLAGMGIGGPASMIGGAVASDIVELITNLYIEKLGTKIC